MKRDEFTTAMYAYSYPQHELRARIDFIMFWYDEEPAEIKVEKAQRFLSLVDEFDDVMSSYWMHELMAQSGCGGNTKQLNDCIIIAAEIKPDLPALRAELDAYPTFEDLVQDAEFPYEHSLPERFLKERHVTETTEGT